MREGREIQIEPLPDWQGMRADTDSSNGIRIFTKGLRKNNFT